MRNVFVYEKNILKMKILISIFESQLESFSHHKIIEDSLCSLLNIYFFIHFESFARSAIVSTN